MRSIENGSIRWFASLNGKDITPVSQGYGGKGSLCKELQNSLYPGNNDIIADSYGGVEEMCKQWAILSKAVPETHLKEVGIRYTYLCGWQIKTKKDYIRMVDIPEDQRVEMEKEIARLGLRELYCVQFTKYPKWVVEGLNAFCEKYGYYPMTDVNLTLCTKDFIKRCVKFEKKEINMTFTAK